ncbi:hypothetical protein [Solemya elarraichensis gill symbiont]|uniref:Uncharacterized protein n=1 Tax=Solemya elarraichensis gill symbiont TaxID=1918949 RepID=A0A1T2KSU3_9GAMM|nr:hypothetical protein [Solemya elarraichensis gill symbiont]OOZ35903.1 hypothetical protein BOW52_11070 [Solemya elarraichensis gill symbiont]
MNPSKLYVPNPQKWVQFFDKMARGKLKWGQHGGGSVSRIIPMDQYISAQSDGQQFPVKIVSPAEQTVDQAKSELVRENIKPSTIQRLFQKETSRPTKHSSKNKTSKNNNKNKKSGKITKKPSGKQKKNKLYKIKKNVRDIFEY